MRSGTELSQFLRIFLSNFGHITKMSAKSLYGKKKKKKKTSLKLADRLQ